MYLKGNIAVVELKEITCRQYTDRVVGHDIPFGKLEYLREADCRLACLYIPSAAKNAFNVCMTFDYQLRTDRLGRIYAERDRRCYELRSIVSTLHREVIFKREGLFGHKVNESDI